MLTTEQFHEFLAAGPCLMDGATGSNLMKAGMPRGCCAEAWILENPQPLLQLQSAYAAAGSQMLYAPTFRDSAEKETEDCESFSLTER